MNTFDAWNEMEKERQQRKDNATCSEWISVKERLPEIGKNVLWNRKVDKEGDGEDG